MGPSKKKVLETTRDYPDPLSSSRSGFAGFAETLLRRFKFLVSLGVALLVYGCGAFLMGCAIAPGVAAFDLIREIDFLGTSVFAHYFLMGFAGAVGFLVYGFSILALSPAANFIFRLRLRNWRGPYYSLEAVRWYLHNALIYIVRYTFLEFVTPTPFNLMFYRGMGMKIGQGTTINSTCISDACMITLGDRVTIGGSVTLIAHYGQGGYLVLAPTVIGEGATIGLKATIMGGVIIGEGARVLPNSVVLPKTQIGAGETWGGVPARKLDTDELRLAQEKSA